VSLRDDKRGHVKIENGMAGPEAALELRDTIMEATR
jgi:hypothetical protein